LILSGQVIERRALRYTPAGLPAQDFSLKHESEVIEDGQPRKVSLELKAVAVGEMASAVSRLVLGADAQFAGFLASGRNGRGFVFHLTAID
jgi:primosomal replication protein N